MAELSSRSLEDTYSKLNGIACSLPVPSREIHAFEKCVKSLKRSPMEKGHSYRTAFINSFWPPIPCPPILKLCLLLFSVFPERLSAYQGCFTVCQFCFVAGFLFQRSFHGSWSFHGADGSWSSELLPRLGFSALFCVGKCSLCNPSSCMATPWQFLLSTAHQRCNYSA